ncbi:MAG: response regulator transcription factor [Acidimicrobiales bacterium]
MRILVVDDETELADAVGKALRREGYAVDVVYTASDALDVTSYTPYDLITLDLTLPDGDGRDICRTIRTEHEHQPRVLMLTARDDIEERVAGLDDGADDYLVKPFALPELFARVRTLLRRDADAAVGAELEIAGLTLDTAAHRVTWKEVEIEMTAKEFALLRYFMTHADDVHSQEQLLEHVWDAAADPFTNTVRVTVGTLRRKLSAATDRQWIETVIGAGYRFVRDPEPA